MSDYIHNYHNAVKARYAMKLEERLAMIHNGPNEPVPADSRFELEEIQLHSWNRMHWQERADRVRRMRHVLRQIHMELGCFPADGEPTFVLLGRDPQAPELVEKWAADRQVSEPDKVSKWQSAYNIASRMRSWFASNVKGEQKPTAETLEEADPVAVEGRLVEEEGEAPLTYVASYDAPSAELLLIIFREFVIRNMHVWVEGADHHPIWPLLAEAIGPAHQVERNPIVQRFIFAGNRLTLAQQSQAEAAKRHASQP